MNTAPHGAAVMYHVGQGSFRRYDSCSENLVTWGDMGATEGCGCGGGVYTRTETRKVTFWLLLCWLRSGFSSKDRYQKYLPKLEILRDNISQDSSAQKQYVNRKDYLESQSQFSVRKTLENQYNIKVFGSTSRLAGSSGICPSMISEWKAWSISWNFTFCSNFGLIARTILFWDSLFRSSYVSGRKTNGTHKTRCLSILRRCWSAESGSTVTSTWYPLIPIFG